MLTAVAVGAASLLVGVGTAGAATNEAQLRAGNAAAAATTTTPTPTASTSSSVCPTSTGPVGTIPPPAPSPSADTEPPTAPGKPVLTLCGSTLFVEWTPSTDNVGVSHYVVSRLISDLSFSYTVTRPLIGFTYTGGYEGYGVRAYDAAGNSSLSAWSTIGVPPACPPPSTCPGSTTSSTAPPPDTQAPTAPGTPTVAVANGVATVTWTPSTDNVGVASYQLHHQYSDVVEILNVPGGSTSYSVSVASAGQHSFWLYAKDAAGNTSPASGRTTIGTPAPCPPLVPCPTSTTSSPVTSCAVNYTVLSEWPGGFQGQVAIRNTGTTAVSGWQLGWTFANGQRITQLWGGTYVQPGANVTVTHVDWTKTIAPGDTVTFGFLGSRTGTNTKPTSFKLNGGPCALS